jgi:hypothetical protein
MLLVGFKFDVQLRDTWGLTGVFPFLLLPDHSGTAIRKAQNSWFSSGKI